MSNSRSVRDLGPRFLALWVGQAVSQFGTYVAFLTLPFLVVHIKGQGYAEATLEVALTYALENIPTLLVGLVGGVLLDRWHLRPVMIAADLIRASAFFYLAATLDNYGVGTVFALALLIGSMTTLFDGALYSMIPSVVRHDQLAEANGLMSAAQQVNFALGPLAAGVLVLTTGTTAVGLFLNGLTFVVSAISLQWVGRVPHHRPESDVRSGFLTEAIVGIRYIVAEPRLRATTIAAAIPNFVVGFIEGTFVVLAAVVLLTQNEGR
ncbi:MAG: MFS transporter, partial [Acidimicrobiia bacterium]|nr:MFS transporter [Acidimicrobiia bacterium]